MAVFPCPLFYGDVLPSVLRDGQRLFYFARFLSHLGQNAEYLFSESCPLPLCVLRYSDLEVAFVDSFRKSLLNHLL